MHNHNTDIPELDIIDTAEQRFNKNVPYYLSGPMSGYPDFNFPEFEFYCSVLREAGITVQSPHEIDHHETPESRGSLPYEVYMQAALDLMEGCKGIILMPGWPQSTGACREISRSIDLGMPVYFIHDPDEWQDNIQLVDMNRRPPT